MLSVHNERNPPATLTCTTNCTFLWLPWGLAPWRGLKPAVLHRKFELIIAMIHQPINLRPSR